MRGEDTMEELSARLSDLLASHDISQRELSRATGISASTICRIIGEQQDITAYTLVKIADYFGVTTDYLLGRE